MQRVCHFETDTEALLKVIIDRSLVIELDKTYKIKDDLICFKCAKKIDKLGK